jgi:hypothetical protein
MQLFMTEEEAEAILDKKMEFIRAKITNEDCAQVSQQSAGGPLATPDCSQDPCCGCCAAFQEA